MIVIGAGPMGLMHVLFARAVGASTVIAVEPLAARGELALGLGADAVITPEEALAAVERYTGGEGFDVVIVSVPMREAQEQAIELAAVQGRIHLCAGLPKGVPFPSFNRNGIHYRRLTVTGTTGASSLQFRRTAELVARRRLNLAPFVSQTINLSEVLAVLTSHRRPEQLKSAVSLLTRQA